MLIQRPACRYHAEAKRADELAGDCARLMSEVAAVNDKWLAARTSMQQQQQQQQQMMQQRELQQQLQQQRELLQQQNPPGDGLADPRGSASTTSAPVHISLVSAVTAWSQVDGWPSRRQHQCSCSGDSMLHLVHGPRSPQCLLP